MRHVKLIELSTILFTLMLFFSCKNDDPIVGPPITQEFGHDVFEFYYLQNKKDISSFDLQSIYGRTGKDSTWVLGIKNNKRWMGLYEEPSKKILNEWVGEETITGKDACLKFIPQFTITSDGIYFIVFPASGQYKTNNFIGLTTGKKLVQYGHPSKKDINFKSISQFNKEKLIISYYENNIENFCIMYTNGNIYADDVTCNYPKELLTMFLAGFTNDNRIWFAECNKDKTLITEWIGTQNFNRNITIKKEQLKDTTFFAKNMELVQAYPSKSLITATRWGFAANPIFNSEFTPYYFLLNNDKALFINHNGDMLNWFEESIIIDHTVYSPLAKEICTLKIIPDRVEPISYNEGIYIQKRAILRTNLQTGKNAWTTRIDKLDNVKENSEIEISLTEQKNDKWIYSCHISDNESGNDSFSFSIDVNTGILNYL